MPKSVSRDISPKQLAVGGVSSVIVISKTSVPSLPQSSIADIVPVQLPTSKPVTTQVISPVNASNDGGATTAVGSVTVSVGSPTPKTPPKKNVVQLSIGTGATTVIVASQPPATDSVKSGVAAGKVGAISSTTGILIVIGAEVFPHSSITLYCKSKSAAQPASNRKSPKTPSLKVADGPQAPNGGSLTSTVKLPAEVQLSILASTKSVAEMVISQPASTTNAVPAAAEPFVPIFVSAAGSIVAEAVGSEVSPPVSVYI